MQAWKADIKAGDDDDGGGNHDEDNDCVCVKAGHNMGKKYD